MNPLRLWLRNSTMTQKQQLADLADTSIPTLRLAAAAYRTEGVVSLDPAFARRIEIAIATIGDPTLPVVKREDLATVCKTCEYQRQCNQFKK